MSEIDPLVAEILLKGDDEFLSKIKRVGDEAVENFHKLDTAARDGITSFAAVTGALHLIEVALAGVTAATIAFIDAQTELSQSTLLLADAFGTTGEQLQNIEQVFASSGVKVEQFERFAVRLTGTIAREWPAIAESIKNYATENDAAQLRVTTAILRVEDAQKNLMDHSAERSAQMVKDNLSLEQSYIKLQFSAQHAAQEQVASANAVSGAQLSVTAALQRLATLEGRPPSAAEKANLEHAQAQQAVDNARAQKAAARLAQQEKLAQATLKQKQMEQEYDDLSRKAAKNARDDAEQRVKDQNAVKEAVIQRAEAEAKADKFALTNISSIKSALAGVSEGNKDAAKQIDLSQVSVENLKKGFIALAKEGTKATTPTGWDALRTLAKLFEGDVDHLISPQQRLRLVTELSGSAMQSLGKSAAEMLDVIENGSGKFEKIAESSKKFENSIDGSRDAIKDYRGALTDFNLTISQFSQQVGAAIAPAFTAFLQTLDEWFKALKESASDAGGMLHMFGKGIENIGILIKGVLITIGQFVTAVQEMTAQIDKAFGLQEGTAFKVLLIGIAGVVAAMIGPWAAIPLIIAEIITSLGGMTDAVHKAYEAMKDNSVTRFWEQLTDVIAKAKSLLTGGGWQNPFGDKVGGNADTSSFGKRASATDVSEGTAAMATGGPVSGPGSGTSDSILARLSNGEFVVKAAAVQAYGAGLFHALNNMMLPGFAQGGLVAAPVRMGGGAIAPASSTLNLSIDGRSFNGLRGPKSTIDDLSNFAIARQTSAAGSNPSWMK